MRGRYFVKNNEGPLPFLKAPASLHFWSDEGKYSSQQKARLNIALCCLHRFLLTFNKVSPCVRWDIQTDRRTFSLVGVKSCIFWKDKTEGVASPIFLPCRLKVSVGNWHRRGARRSRKIKNSQCSSAGELSGRPMHQNNVKNVFKA